MTSRYSISFATVVTLVLLRLCIGWHFFSEGAKHVADPHWTSEPVLRSAKGPLASWYHAYLPDFHGFDRLLHGGQAHGDAKAVEGWARQVQDDWSADLQKFSDRFHLDEQQRQRADAILHEYQAKVREWAAENRDALDAHIHQWQRKETTREKPEGALPFQKKRVAEKQTSLAAEAGGWLADLRGMERKYDEELKGLLNDGQQRLGAWARRLGPIDSVDQVMSYGILAIGVLLLLGLLTRLASLAGALFLLSVVLMQPFWVSDTVPTFNQYVEMFALLTLATTPVGRWCGLDCLLARIFHASSSTKGKSDVPKS